MKIPSQTPIAVPQKSGRYAAKDSSPASRLGQAEREASRQITEAQKRAAQMNRQINEQIEETRENASEKISLEQARAEEKVEKIKEEGRELADQMKREQDQEIRRIRRQGDKEVEDLTHYYRNKLYNTQHKNEISFRDMQAEHGKNVTYERLNQDYEKSTIEDKHKQEIANTINRYKHQIEEMRKSEEERYQKLKANYEALSKRNQEHFEEKQAEEFHKQTKTLQDIQSRARDVLEDMRVDTATKLAAYSERQQDPFYRLMDLDTSVRDMGDIYYITADVPTHEQSGISLSISGNIFQITGQRRNQETVEVSPGEFKTTSSFQTYTHRIPLDYPVETKELLKEFVGDTMRIYLPKKGPHASRGPFQAKPERLKVERPKFPSNLPKITAEKTQENPENEGNRTADGGSGPSLPKVSKRTPSSGTLS